LLHYEEIKKLANNGIGEPIEATTSDLRDSNMSVLPEGIVLSVFVKGGHSFRACAGLVD